MNETRLSDTAARLWRRWEQRRSAVASARNDRIATETSVSTVDAEAFEMDDQQKQTAECC
jgi:hypothetical protein